MATQTLVEQTQTLNLKGEDYPRLSLRDYPRTEITPALGLLFDKSFHWHNIFKLPKEEQEQFYRALAYELAINGVAIFPTQNDVTPAELEIITSSINKYSGAPSDGGFHIHPVQDNWSDTPGGSVMFIGGPNSSRFKDNEGKNVVRERNPPWHSDISFEARPATYSLLRVYNPPRTGGDTLFLSNEAVYDKLTPPFAKFLEGLTATHSGKNFVDFATQYNRPLNAGPRGAPENVGTNLDNSHPLIRTHPLTGVKSVFVSPGFTQYIDQLNFDESKAVLDYLFKLQRQSHDVQIRHKWSKNDIVLWDNRTTVHTATYDYGSFTREGDRSTVIGEKPYFDPNSISRKQFLEKHPQRLDLPDIQL